MGRDDLAAAVELDAVGGDLEVFIAGEAVRNGFFSFVQRLHLAAFASHRLEVVEVAVGYRRNVFTTEDSHLEVLGRAQTVLPCDLRAGSFQVIQILVNNTVGANVFADTFDVPVVSNQLGGRGQVDTVDMSMSIQSQSIKFFLSRRGKGVTYVISGEQLAR